jgi:hypothetical protein
MTKPLATTVRVVLVVDGHHVPLTVCSLDLCRRFDERSSKDTDSLTGLTANPNLSHVLPYRFTLGIPAHLYGAKHAPLLQKPAMVVPGPLINSVTWPRDRSGKL